VKLAAFLIVLYGLAVLAQAALLRLSGLLEERELLRAVSRCAGTVLLAWGLVNGRNWAWWLSVLGCGLAGLLGAVSLATLLGVVGADSLPLGTVGLLSGCLMVGALGTSFLLLVLPHSRRAFT
jgi:hypothetical protein